MTNNRPVREKQESHENEGVERASARAVYRPAVDIIETAEAVFLIADMPGVDESETNVALENNVLTIRGSVKSTQVEGYSPAYSEYGEGDFERAFTISNEIDRERLEATVKDGVLRVTLPKTQRVTSKKVTVSAG